MLRLYYWSVKKSCSSFKFFWPFFVLFCLCLCLSFSLLYAYISKRMCASNFSLKGNIRASLHGGGVFRHLR